MAKIGTAHVEIKPVINDEALAQITEAIEKAVRAGVEAGIRAAKIPNPSPFGGRVTVTNPHAVGVEAHNHREYVEGCFRCDLSRDER